MVCAMLDITDTEGEKRYTDTERVKTERERERGHSETKRECTAEKDWRRGIHLR